MAAMATPEQTQALVCYRHPGRETAVSCSSCERPICPDCMVFASVGIKCPECAGQPTGTQRTASRVRTLAGEGSGYVVTKALIAVTLGVYLLQILDTGDIRDPGGELYFRGALFGPLIEDGEWWRLVTNAFLHGSPLHILFNLLMLWWFGRPLELLLGRGRFVGIFAVSILAGSAGALLYKPDVPTIGASGAVFGILGAGLVLERNRIDVFGGAALLVVAFNLVFSFVLSYVSIGGHVGGLVGGALAMLAMTQFGRQHAVYGRLGAIGVASLVGVGAASVLLAFLSVYGYV
jgi:membrane associated rhomboid family serine protease